MNMRDLCKVDEGMVPFYKIAIGDRCQVYAWYESYKDFQSNYVLKSGDGEGTLYNKIIITMEPQELVQRITHENSDTCKS